MTAMGKGSSFQLGILAAAAAVAGAVLLGAETARAKVGDKAGVAGAVRGTVSQASYNKPKQTIGRKVASGDLIYLGDRITTGGKSGLQIMLLDRTTFTIGPDAEMRIDKFVYDPKTSKGAMSARILKGTFRFVSGAIERNNPSNVTITTPAATIGIRGTTIIGRTDGTNLLIILAGPGRRNNVGRPASRLIITAGGQRVVIFRAGFGTFVARIGAGPSRPQRYDLGVLAGLLRELFSRPASQETNALDLIAPGAGPGSTAFANFFGNFTGQGTQQGATNADRQTNVDTFWISLRDRTVPDGTGTKDRRSHRHRRHKSVRGIGVFRWVGFGHHRTLQILLRIGRPGHHGHSALLLLKVVRVLKRDRFGRPTRMLVSYNPPGPGRFRLAVVTVGRPLGFGAAILKLSRPGFRHRHHRLGGPHRHSQKRRHAGHHRKAGHHGQVGHHRHAGHHRRGGRHRFGQNRHHRFGHRPHRN